MTTPQEQINTEHILGHLREALGYCKDEENRNRTRELSLVKTKIDEAILWMQYHNQLQTPPINEEGINTNQ